MTINSGGGTTSLVAKEHHIVVDLNLELDKDDDEVAKEHHKVVDRSRELHKDDDELNEAQEEVEDASE